MPFYTAEHHRSWICGTLTAQIINDIINIIDIYWQIMYNMEQLDKLPYTGVLEALGYSAVREDTGRGRVRHARKETT